MTNRMAREILMACDHAGYDLKERLKVFLTQENIAFVDLGVHSTESCSYADQTKIFVKEFQKRFPSTFEAAGVLVCGSGQGVAMAANRGAHIRAALCLTPEMARLSRTHNAANVLCLGSRLVDSELAVSILSVFLETSFEGGRHESRVRSIDES